MASLDVPRYDPAMVRPMREELTRIGFTELRTAAEVDAALTAERATTLVVVNSVCGCAARNARPAATLALEHQARPAKLYTVFAGQDADATERAPTLVVVNSVCGCAARNARPAAALAIQHDRRPSRLVTVFAGQDADATARARSYFTGYQPSSPQIALFKDGRLVFMLERRNIEGRNARDIAADLTAAFDKFC